ncbi:unnamed protein product [Rhizophagus irregularis]|uniref:Uncharacterized protein n=1 Tax=Rhizophagus irregularis TaxID=588596 RepID=A0A915Z4U8_9GLOM|nr:unnamed protein product [Rhizophagus irregularis]
MYNNIRYVSSLKSSSLQSSLQFLFFASLNKHIKVYQFPNFIFLHDDSLYIVKIHMRYFPAMGRTAERY